MSYKSAKFTYPESPFSWGMVDNSISLFLKDEYSPYLRNARLDGQATIIRPWHSLIATLTAGAYPKGIGSYLRASAANDVLVIRHNTSGTQKLYTMTTAGALTSITTAALVASDNRMIYQNIWDVIYCMNGSDLLGKLNGTTYTTVTASTPASFAPAFSVVFGGSHWASGWSTNSNKVYKSIADNYEDFTGSGSDSVTFSEQVTGLSANLEALFYFTKNSISVTGVGDITDTAGTITYGTRSLNVKEWAVNHASIVEAGVATYFLSSSNKINKIAKGQNIDWFEVLELSERKYNGISEIMSTLAVDQTDSFGYFLPKENLIKWFVKTKWSLINDICIIYDIGKDKFLVDNNKYFFDGVFFKGINYTVSMIEPKVYQDEINQDDEDSGIQFEYWTKEFYISDPTYKKILWETRTLLDINELQALTQEIWIDGGLVDTKTLWIANYSSAVGWIGTNAVGMSPVGMSSASLSGTDDDYQEIYILRTKWNLNVKGKKIQFRYKISSLAGKVRLKNISMLVEPLPWITNNLTI